MANLKLGTRKSLLAWAQSSWVAREVERLNPGCSVELVGIETRGDRILDVSLRQVAGKEFFVAELDEALHSGRVDFTVHSMKDLSLDRPEAFINAAIPPRENPRDVILFGPRVMEKIAAGKKLKIGTSSPRRIENIPSFLEKALPVVQGREPSVELVEIRGNVNTRLSRVHEADGSERHLDAVVLAFAGLIRLWKDEKGREELSRLLQGVRWMVLPLRECPAAPAQGALAVECRRQDARVREMLGRLHDPVSAASAAQERQLLADWGGGCHQRFGATAFGTDKLGVLMYVRGAKPSGEFVEELRWGRPAFPMRVSGDAVWDGTHWRREAEKAGADLSQSADFSGDEVFVAHGRAASHASVASRISQRRVWTSGTGSWFQLARQGVWVEGCAENLGFEYLLPTLKEGVLQLKDFSAWTVLTHESATKDWDRKAARVIATYRVGEGSYPDAAREALQRASYVFWSSGSQFDELKQWVSPEARHACGPGKTFARLSKTLGEKLTAFPSVEEWRKWTRPENSR